MGPAPPGRQRPNVSIERRVLVALVLVAEFVVIVAAGRLVVGRGPWEYWVSATFGICILLFAIRPDLLDRFRKKPHEHE